MPDRHVPVDPVGIKLLHIVAVATFQNPHLIALSDDTFEIGRYVPLAQGPISTAFSKSKLSVGKV